MARRRRVEGGESAHEDAPARPAKQKSRTPAKPPRPVWMVLDENGDWVPEQQIKR